LPFGEHPVSLVARRWLDAAAVYVFPSRCFVCDRTLPQFQYLGACTACWAALVPMKRPACARCALPLPAAARGEGPAGARCMRCVMRPLPLDEAIAAVLYDESARRFLLRAKDHGRAEILRPLGAQLAASVCARGTLDRVDVIVPVPSSLSARVRRGFDPASLLAREVARVAGLPLLRTVLRRRAFSGPASKGLSAAARWRGSGRRVAARGDLVGARVLLVDDVLTTGATAAACASALRDAGASEIRAAVWARTPAPARAL
jgi:ComF family protein